MAEKKKSKGPWWRKYTRDYLDEIENELNTKPTKSRKSKQDKLFTFDPFEQMDKIHEQMERTFKGLFNFGFPEVPSVLKMNEGIFRRPRIEMKETKKEILVAVELPGIKKENIKLKIVDNNLIIDAQAKSKREQNKKGFSEFSTSYNGYRHVIRLPSEVDISKSRAKYSEGILKVILPKKETKENQGDIRIE